MKSSTFVRNNIKVNNIAKESGIFYVYALYRPDNTPFYVGVGQWERKPRGERYEDHLRETLNPGPKSNLHKLRTIEKIINEEKKIRIDILCQYFSIDEAFDKEIELIEKYGRRIDGTGILTNLTKGGDGVVGWDWPSGKDHPWYGRHHTDESKEKMRKLKQGTVLKKQTRKKMSKTHKTRLRNMSDKERAFRNSSPKRLTESDVIYIRSETINSRHDKELLAEKFNVSVASINDVLARRSYKWVS